jgi:hypothetical protein
MFVSDFGWWGGQAENMRPARAAGGGSQPDRQGQNARMEAGDIRDAVPRC